MDRTRKFSALAGAIGALVAACAFAAPAHAGVLTKSATDCNDGPLSQPFARYGDGASYESIGSFENGTGGWVLTGGAKVVSGNETAHVAGASDSHSLSLPNGSSATTPAVCVGLDEPTMRFFTRKNSGLLSTMAVTVHVQTSLGLWLELPIGVDLGGSWHPSLPMLVVANLLPLLPGDRTPVKFTFRPLLGGNWLLDDVYVDPLARVR